MIINRRVRIVLSLILAASIVSVSACTGKSSTGTSGAASDASQMTIYGKVTAISGSSITLAIGTLNSRQSMGTPPATGNGTADETGTGDQTNGTPPALPSDNGQADSSAGKGQADSSAGNGQADSSAGNGQVDSSAGNGQNDAQGPGDKASADGDILTLTGDSIVITATDKTTYSNQAIAGPGDQAQVAATTSATTSSDETTGAEVTASLSDISVGTVLQVVYTESTSEAVSIAIVTGMDGGGAPGGSAPGGTQGGSSSVDTGTGAYVVTDGESLSGKTYTSTNADENAVRAEGTATASLDKVTVEKTDGAASSNDASSFYGLNSAILALDKSTLNITGGTVTATAEGANGVFAYDGATINITGTVINVSGGNAGGIEVAGGGTMNATDLTVNSTVKAAIRSDRGGGTMTVNGGTYTTGGSAGAPAIYSTADITVSNAKLTANNSEAVVVEGLNSVTLNDCDVTGNMEGTYGAASGENIHNVMLYQSMSGDAETGTSSFTMNGGTLVSRNGDMFYVTNTDCVISLSGVTLTPADGTYLLNVSGNDGSNGWGTAGANGGTCAFNLSKQTISGDITVDAISKLAMTISDSSSFTGSVNSDKTTAASLSVTIDGTSKWTLTADSYITSFTGSMDNVDTNGHTLYVNGTAMN